MTREGLIVRSNSGLYTVECDGENITCSARGIFRKKNISPCAGDIAVIESVNNDEYILKEIKPRKNEIIRPPLANIDNLVFVISTCEPSPDFVILDKFIAVAEYKNIGCIIAVTKSDLEQRPDIKEIYDKAGIDVVVIDYSDSSTYMKLYDMLSGKISAFTGNSGAGKSTLLNHIDESLDLKTNAISRKLGRGKHTTRQVELYKLENGGYIADTPGFSTFDTHRYDFIVRKDLRDCFREFRQFEGECRFSDCAHYNEKGCVVIEAVENGEISTSRHKSYRIMYEEAASLNEWERNK